MNFKKEYDCLSGNYKESSIINSKKILISMVNFIKSKLILIIISIVSFILVVNIALKLISEPSDIAFYLGLLLLFASFTIIYKLINFLIKSLNKPKL